MGWLRLVGSLKLQVSFVECRLFYRALLQKRPIIIRRGWVFLERTRILSRIQFTTHVIEFVVVETKRLVGSTINSEDHFSAGRGRQTPSASILFSHTNLAYVVRIKMERRVRSRSVHKFGTCKQNAAVQYRLPTTFAAKHVF